MEEEKRDLLDVENNIEFLFNILKGDKESFIELELWYKKKILDKNQPIESYKSGIYKLMEFAYNLNQEKNKQEKEKEEKKKEECKIISLQDDDAEEKINLKTIFKEINELKKKDKEKEEQIKELKQKDREKEEQINELKKKDQEKEEQIKELEQKEGEKAEQIKELEQKEREKADQIKELEQKEREKAEQIKELEQKEREKAEQIKELEQKEGEKADQIKDIQKEQFILSLKNDIMKFISDTQIFVGEKKMCYDGIQIHCLNKKYQLNEVDIAVLKSMALELYSFKNLSFYRKISYILLKEIIEENKNYIKYITGYFKVTNGNKKLQNIINYFFWIKDSISQLIHFSKSARTLFNAIIGKSKKDELGLKDISNIKSIDELNDGLNEYTNNTLIDCMELNKPLLFFRQKTFNKENINFTLEKLIKETKKNIDGEIIEFNSKLLDLKQQMKKIDNNSYIKDIKDKKLIEEYNKNIDYVKSNSDLEKEIEKIEELKRSIKKGIEKVMEYKDSIKTNYFIFKDFTNHYIETKNLNNFNPPVICRELLTKKLKFKVNFEESEDKNLEDLLK